MAFTRKALAGLGLSEEMAEKVITLHGTSMSDFIPKSELKVKIDEAVAEAQRNISAPNVKASDDYKALQRDFDSYKKKIEISSQLKEGGVKEKFLDNVYSLLEEGKEPLEQLETIKQQYEEYFMPTEDKTPAQTPQFGAQVKGQMPSGNTGKTIESVWGLPSK